MSEQAPALLGDIGGTHCRFALYRRDCGTYAHRGRDNERYADLAAAITDYLAGVDERPRRAALAVAAPLTGERVTMTNRGWSFSAADLAAALGLTEVRLVNDFAGVALSLPRLAPDDCHPIGPAREPQPGPRLVLGPGTGLGLAALIPHDTGWIPVATEGGHVTLAARDDTEAEIIARARARHDHVSAERLLSGPGLVTLYSVVAELHDRRPAALDTGRAVTQAALSGDDPAAKATLGHFFAMLGTVAGNAALDHGALGGVYLAGGILPNLLEAFAASRFRERFTAKGRYRDYLDAIPSAVITHAHPTHLGLAQLIDQTAAG